MVRPLRTGILISITGLGLLAACDEIGQTDTIASRAGSTDAVTEPATESTIIEQDVEAPDVFAANESGLWDGRPSLGGIWVAHPDVADPERVMIRNPATGQFVVGALFRRERDNPGPRIQVSSDAAAELGMLAGQPAILDVVALRRETVEIPVEVSPEDASVPETEIAEAEELGDTELPDAEVAALSEETAEEEAPRKGFFAKLFAPKAVEETADTTLEAAEPIEEAAIETAALDPIATATAAIAEAETTPVERPAEPEQTEVASLEEVAPVEVAEPVASLKDPYVQIGIFSLQENAQNTAESLRGIGLLPTIREQEASGKKFWRVVVGPATNNEDRKIILSKVRDLGFADAYYVTN